MTASHQPDDSGERNPTNEHGSERDGLALDDLFEAMKSPRRRYLLHHLVEAGAADLDEAAERIAAWEEDTAPEHVAAEDRERVRADMVHTHLPKLSALDLVEYDLEEKRVRVGENGEKSEPYLEFAAEYDL